MPIVSGVMVAADCDERAWMGPIIENAMQLAVAICQARGETDDTVIRQAILDAISRTKRELGIE